MRLRQWLDCSLPYLGVLLVLLAALPGGAEGARGRGRGKGKSKNMLPFGNIAEYSLVKETQRAPGAAKIVKGSHFYQTYKLGYKILLICIAEGTPRPFITWYKNGAEVPPNANVNVWSKLEIDPATMGDQGIYSCMTNNKLGLMAKNFRVESDTGC